jgi:MarR family transcriptional regulator, organic hydroperoxide resistance regulator
LANQLLPALLARASEVISEEFYQRLNSRKISTRRWRLLAMLWENDGHTIGNLSKGMLVSQPSTTRIVEKAAKEGLVEKTASPVDRRQVIVRLTDLGSEYIQDLVTEALRVDGELTRKIEPAEILALRKTLLKLIED